MTKSQTSSLMSWTLPALSVPPVPALLTILISHQRRVANIKNID